MKKLPTTLSLVLVVSSAVLAACTVTTGDGTPANNPSGGSTSSSSGGASSSGGNEGSSSGGNTSSGGTTGEAKIGSVTISQSEFSAAGQTFSSYSAMATFFESATTSAPNGTTSKCTQSKEGDCNIMVCDTSGTPQNPQNPQNPPPAGEAKKSPTASDITVKAMSEITLTPDAATGNYAPKTGQTKLLEAGADVTVKAKGAEVPAFEQTLKAPSAISLTTAWPAAGTPFNVNRGDDLKLDWDNGTAGDVTATVSSIVQNKSVSTVTCTFKADAGTGTIPKAALGKLDASDTGSISVSASSSALVEQGGWKITVMATSPAAAGTSVASGSAKIQ